MMVKVPPQSVLIRLANDQHTRITRSMSKWTPEKKIIVARRKCEKLKIVFDTKFEFDGTVKHTENRFSMLFIGTTKVAYGITPQELMTGILKKYIQMVQSGQWYPSQKINLDISEFAAYYAVWYTYSRKLKGEPQRVILDRLVKQILPPNKLTEPTNGAKVYNRLFKEASLILPTTTDKQIKNLKKSCESKVSRYIDKIKREEL